MKREMNQDILYVTKEGLDKFSLFSRVFLNSALDQEQTEENADTEEDCQGE